MRGTKRGKAKAELPGKTRLRSEIVEAMRGLHKIGAVNDDDLEKTTVRMLWPDMLPKVRRCRPLCFGVIATRGELADAL